MNGIELLPTLLCAAALFSLFVAAYPFFIFPLLLLTLRRVLAYRVRNWWIVPHSPPRINSAAILFCAHNEGASICDKLDNAIAVQASSNVPVAIFVYLDGCTDDTETRVAQFSDRVHIVSSHSRTGKSRGMRVLMKHATQDIILFTDANVQLSTNVINRALTIFVNDPLIGCLAGRVLFGNNTASTNTHNESVYWRLENLLRRAESAVGSCLCATGALFVIRRELFVPPPDDIIDDFHTTLRVLLARRKVIFDQYLVAHEEAAISAAQELRRKLRIACRAFNCFRLLRPQIRQLPIALRWIFLSHKLLRWLSGFFVLTALIFLAFAGLVAWPTGSLMLLFALFMSAFIDRFLVRVPYFRTIGSAVAAMLATSAGVILSLQGERFITWKPTASAPISPSANSDE